MSDFSELCPLFETGVYNELYLGQLTGTIYTSATYNFLGPVGAPTAMPSSFRLGRTVVLTEVYVRRNADLAAPTVRLKVGRRTASGTATQSFFGTLTFLSNIVTFPDIQRAWQAMGPTSFTLNTADVLDISIDLGTDATGLYDIIIQYREK